MWSARRATTQLFAKKGADTIEERRAVLNSMRKEVRTYMTQIFPDLLNKGESTHMLRKLYLQFAFRKFGKGKMKETGFASKVFGHEGYGTSLHYTTVILN
tara:strand:+ start:251 stop:550 length:300 start_codon:yes stop_codon:yes gene_type:complete